MPTPKQGYYNAAGDRLPGTTTVIGRFKESGGLIQWAYKQGREHERLVHQGKEAPRHLYDVSDKAAEIGTTVHSMVEARIKGDNADTVLEAALVQVKDSERDDYKKKALSGFDAYRQWERMTTLKVVDQEMQLVSEQFQFGGTPDAIGEIDGKLCLVDWKTSNGVYQDYLIQLAAYKHLWEENHPDRLLTGGSHLCRFAKEHGDFAHHFYPNLDEAWSAFKLMRELYDLDKGLKRRAA